MTPAITGGGSLGIGWPRSRRPLIRAPLAFAATVIFAALLTAAVAAPWLAPVDPFDPSSIRLGDSRTAPLSVGPESQRVFWLGADLQGRDILSCTLYGLRISILVGMTAVAIAMVSGVVFGLLAGWFDGPVSDLIMRAADVQLSLPTILVALLFDGVARAVIEGADRGVMAYAVVIAAIAISNWPHFARPVRGLVMVEKGKAYVDAALIAGTSRTRILATHILPNILGPILVIATLSLVFAILMEATLSFLGVGVPASHPSLGTLVEEGRDHFRSGAWWIIGVPGLALVLLTLSVNLLGDWLRDATDPRFSRDPSDLR